MFMQAIICSSGNTTAWSVHQLPLNETQIIKDYLSEERYKSLEDKIYLEIRNFKVDEFIYLPDSSGILSGKIGLSGIKLIVIEYYN